MKKYLISALIITLFTISASCKKDNTRVVIKTTMGDIHVELFDNDAPDTVKNFLTYADSHFYDGTIFHRVINSFMIQCGGFNPGMEQKQTAAPIKNEAANGLTNRKGTLAMARTQQIHSATSQFFINVTDNPFLNHGKRDFGYCVFGKVTSGMDIVDAIRMVPTETKGYFQNVPVEDVIIISITRQKAKK